MPIYEYRCGRCGRRTTKYFKTFAAVRTPSCAHCGSRRVERVYSRVAVVKGGAAGDEGAGEDPAGMEDLVAGLESGDPRGFARMARRMSDELGEEIPGEVEGMLHRMEQGEMPSDEEFSELEPEAGSPDRDEEA